jgi:hypothetical protein
VKSHVNVELVIDVSKISVSMIPVSMMMKMQEILKMLVLVSTLT